jgi:hypothetical protein
MLSAALVRDDYVEVLFPRVVQSLWLRPGSFRFLRRQYDGFAVTPKGACSNFGAELTQQRMNSVALSIS